MTREAVARIIHWPWIIWVVGIINPFFMMPQLYKIWATGKADDVSLLMLVILVGIQAGFALHGFFLRSDALLWSNAAATAVTIITAVSAVLVGRGFIPT